MTLTASDHDIVARLLGREPSGEYDIVVTSPSGEPVVIRNAPFLHDGTPMPTLFWLCDPALTRQVSRLEATGGVRAAEAAIDPEEVADAHRRYRLLRDSFIAADHQGPRPSGGVAGTRVGVKCLHAHFAWYLAGGDDPVGRWVHVHLATSTTAQGTPRT